MTDYLQSSEHPLLILDYAQFYPRPLLCVCVCVSVSVCVFVRLSSPTTIAILTRNDDGNGKYDVTN